MMKWTNEQQMAMTAKGGALLISAAAGAGKTAVLVERIIRKITDVDRPTDINRLLTVTFTKAAASEMKDRIRNELVRFMELHPEDQRIQRQFALAEKAEITTIHSFCSQLIRDHFHELNLDADFRVAEQSEMSMLFEDALNDLFEMRYAEKTGAFMRLADTYGDGRDDQKLKDILRDVYRFCMSCPQGVRILRSALLQYDLQEPQSFEMGVTEWGRLIVESGAMMIEQLEPEGMHLVKKMQKEGGFDPYVQTLESDLLILRTILTILNDVMNQVIGWDDARRRICQISQGRLKPLRGCKNESLKTGVQKWRSKWKDVCNTIQQRYFSRSNQEIAQMSLAQKPILETLVETVEQLHDSYTEQKRKKGVLDFSDLEHLAMRLLIKREDGSSMPSETAKRIQTRYDEILIDEYQDSNAVQEAILQAISRNGKNVFMVGDVKQSIYRFRQAMPELFMDKHRRFDRMSDGNSVSDRGRLITLNKNFRSDSQVIYAVNHIFQKLMTGGIFEIDYTDEERLIYGKDETKDDKAITKTEINVIDMSQEQMPTDVQPAPDRITLEAMLTAWHIKKLTDPKTGLMIYDEREKRMRVLQYKDCVVLMRATAQSAAPFSQYMNQLNIPTFTDTGGDFYESNTINTIRALLQIIDNPLQDIPLLGVLQSVIGGFDEQEMARIRIAQKDGSFYEALQYCANDEQPLGQKCAKFLHKLHDWRSWAARMPVDALIWKLYTHTGYMDYVTALPMGSVRNAELKLFMEKARNLHQIGWTGVYDFLRFMEQSAEIGSDGAETAILGENENVVRVMSIHKSKGLEFPCVFILGCAQNFTINPGSNAVVTHQEYGLGAEFIDRMRMYSCPSLQKEAILLKKRNESLAEEMRILYVAMTRAKHKLILIGSTKKPDSLMENADLIKAMGYTRVPQAIASGCTSFLHWIMAAVGHPKDDPFIEKTFDVQVIPAKETYTYHKTMQMPSKPLSTPPDPAAEQVVASKLEAKNRYAPYVHVPVKLSVTELTTMLSQEEEHTASLWQKEDSCRKPRFMMADEPFGNYGTLVHYLYQHIDIQAIRENNQMHHTQRVVKNEINRLVKENHISKEQAKQIHVENIAAFYHTKIGQTMLKSKRIQREMPFYLKMDADEYLKLTDPNRTHKEPSISPIVVQGMIDCWYEDEQGIVLIDYKTNRFSKDPKDEFKRLYQTQLDLYQKALETITKRNVRLACIYAVSYKRFFSFG